MEQQQRKIFTLTDLGKSIRSVIERNYVSTYWIKAEIAKLNHYPRSGHCYPELVDKAANVIKAQMRATIWAADYARINREFLNVAGQTLREGMSILFRASVSFHPLHGLSLQIWEIEPAYTLGEMAMEKTRNMERLKREGVFHQNKSIEMPLLIKNIAVISVETSKGYSDFMNILRAQATGFAWWHFLFPSVLQGDKAAEGIISQLRIIRKVKERFDMVAIIRGGGGDIGLNCYDDYQLAREIAIFPLPVITGIGHSTNETLSEMVAWQNKITPTDVAYFIVEKFRHFQQRIDHATKAVGSKSKGLLKLHSHNLDFVYARFTRAPRQFLLISANLLGNLSVSLNTTAGYLVKRNLSKVDQLAVRLSTLPPKTLYRQNCDLDNLSLRLSSSVRNFMGWNKSAVSQLETKTRLLNPVNVLKRGYSITRFKGMSLKNSSGLKPGDIITTRLLEGVVQSKVLAHKQS